MARESESKRLPRRQLLKGAAVAGAGMAAAGVFGGAKPAWAQTSVPEQWDREADVVIVGAGGTGIVAAIEALEADATVIVLEKAGDVGGTTALSGGIIQGSSSEFQMEQGIEGDTADDHYEYYIQAGEGIADPDLVRLMADNSGPNITWLRDHGVAYEQLSTVSPIPGVDPALMAAPRLHYTQASPGDPRRGAAHVATLYAVAQEGGAEFLLNTAATGLVRDPEQGVIGVRADENGTEVFIKANRAVILATSSYDHNEEMARAFSPQQLWAIQTGLVATAPTCTGDGIKMAMEVGADLAGMGGTIGVPQPGIGEASAPGIWVNKHGQRFVNEHAHYAYKSRAVFQQEGHLAWAIFDDKAREQVTAALGWSTDLEDEVASGAVARGNTLRALANELGINPAQLQTTVEQWNRDVDNGEDNLFGKDVGLQAIDEGPYYGVQILEWNLGSCGGVKINTDAQVIDVLGEVIPRLYAGGMVAGGVIGPYYPGSGTAVCATVCFGRIAGGNAAAEEPWE